MKPDLNTKTVRVTLPEDDICEISHPDWLPDLRGLYSFLLIIILRYPMSLARHVLQKFHDFAQGPSDHSNFITEIRPVLEECAVSMFCAEVLREGSIATGWYL